jgi:phosphoribosylglycinamide formyltransferase-1
MPDRLPCLGVLGSGKGSNFGAIWRALESGTLHARVGVVVADQPGAGILQLAEEAGLPHFFLEETAYRTRLREETEQKLVQILQEHGVEWVVLAGYMRVVKAPLLQAYPGRIVNIHPSLLPQFRGLAAWEQALQAGVTETGCTVHLVDEGVDTGQILGQHRVPVLAGDTAQTLHARIQGAEHELYPAILQKLLHRATLEAEA